MTPAELIAYAKWFWNMLLDDGPVYKFSDTYQCWFSE